MHKLKTIAFIFLSVLLFQINFSCTTEDERTREMELAELDALIKKMESEGKDIDTTDLNVYYFVINEGEGPYPSENDSCWVEYVGYANNLKFEDSKEIHPPNGWWYFIYVPTHSDTNPAHKIKGLIDGIGHMNKGSEIEMIIPSDLAYGSKGAANIPPYTTLIYRAIMRDMRPAVR